jgi:hypothetical protein
VKKRQANSKKEIDTSTDGSTACILTASYTYYRQLIQLIAKGEKEYIWDFGEKARRRETTWKI